MRVLMDVDGVCADFVGGVIALVDEISGKKVQRETLNRWDIFPLLPLSVEERAVFHSRIQKPGFCDSLKMLPGAKEGINAIKRMGIQVVFVTSPYATSPTWCYERSNWLISHGLALNHKEIVHAQNKAVVAGDILVDDNVENVRDWEKHNPNGTGIVWRAPYNVTAEGMKMGQFWELESYIRWRTVQCQIVEKKQPPVARNSTMASQG
jgi:5'(3')-deoxyribonucleotidase